MASNPNPARVTDALWWLWLQLKNLEPSSELGGMFANKSGYHNTRAANKPTNYSVREAEDQEGPADKCAALDWTFPDAQRGDYSTISKYCRRLMASSKDSNDPRLDNLREWYGQADTDSHVEGWDCRHLVEVTSDSSHLWHIHFSFDRGKVADFSTMGALLSVLKGETVAQWRGNGAVPAPEPKPSPVSDVPVHTPGSRVLRLTNPQMTGTDVRFLQRWLGPNWAGVADGVFGPRTADAVRKYQVMRGIQADSAVGRQTWAQMGIRWTG